MSKRVTVVLSDSDANLLTKCIEKGEFSTQRSIMTLALREYAVRYKIESTTNLVINNDAEKAKPRIPPVSVVAASGNPTTHPKPEMSYEEAMRLIQEVEQAEIVAKQVLYGDDPMLDTTEERIARWSKKVTPAVSLVEPELPPWAQK